MSDAQFGLEVYIDDNRFRTGARGINSELQRMKGSAAAVTTQTERMVGAWGGVKSAIFSINGMIAGMGLGLGLHSTIGTIKGMSQELASLQAVTHASAAEMVKYEAQARTMGATTILTATQAASAQKYMGQAGLEFREIYAALPAVLDMAIGAELDMGRAAEVTAITMRSFGMEGENAARRIADVFAGAAADALTDVDMLAEGMKFAAPIAHGLGLTLEETASIVMGLSNAGIQASMSGTTLRASIQDMIRPSSAARAELERLHLSVEDLSVSTHGYIGVIQNLADAGADAESLSKIFDVRGAAGVIALVENVDRLTTGFEKIQNVAGESAYQAAVKQQTLGAAFAGVTSAVQELQLQLGDAGLTNALKHVATETTGVLRVWAGMGDSLGEQKEHFEALTERVELFGSALAGLATYRITRVLIPALVETGKWLAMIIGSIGTGGALPSLAATIGAGTAAWLNYRDSVIEVGETHATVQETAGAMFDVIKGGFAGIPEIVTNAIMEIDAIGDAIKAVAPEVAAVGAWFATPFQGVWEQMQPTLERVITERRRTEELMALVGEGVNLGPEQAKARVTMTAPPLWAELAEARRIEAASWDRAPGPGGISSATQAEVDAGIRAMELMEELRGLGDPLIDAIDEIENRLANLQMTGAFPEQIEAARVEMDRINEGLELAGKLGGSWGVQLGEAYTALHKAQEAVGTATIQELGEFGAELGAVIVARTEEIDGLLEKMSEAAVMEEVGEDAGEVNEELEQMAREIEEVVRGMEKTGDKAEDVADIFESLGRAARDYRREINSVSEGAMEMTRIFQHAEDQMVQAFVHGGMSAREFFSSLAVMAQEALVRQVVVQPIMSGITAAIGGMFGAPAGRMGGYSESLPETQTVGLGAFAGAPEFAGGGTTLGLNPTVAGGGIPAVLHPNEAVVPLTAGRQIPVEITDGRPVEPSASAMVWAPTEMQSFIDNTKSDVRVAHVYVTAQDAGSFVRNRSQIQRAMRTALA